MQESQAKRNVSLSYGMFALVLLGTLLVGFLSGGIFGGVLSYLLNGRALTSVLPLSPALQPHVGPFAIDRPWIGITYVPITPPIARRHNLPVTSGALVTAVMADSPASRAGIRADDIVTAVNKRRLDEGVSLIDIIAAKKPGDKVTLTILREGNELSVEVILGRGAGASSTVQGWQPLERLRRAVDRLLFQR